jgi:asparagine synthase (glutamine-hydrolysing)
MCGFLGLILPSSSDSHESCLLPELDRIQHRGPDSFGLATHNGTTNKLFLGHRRLSIIDTTSSGHQPFFSADQRFILLFNGEIYNYRALRQSLSSLSYSFKTASDTEVLINAWAEWGPASLHLFRGIFSFALVDTHHQKLFLVRDQFGTKPLYYTRKHNTFSFGSEPSSPLLLTNQHIELDPTTSVQYLAYGLPALSTNTFYNNLHQVEPSHYLCVDLCDLSATTVKWYQQPTLSKRSLTFEQAATDFRDKFLESIDLNLVSDVPLACTLSGGLDSSSIVCAYRYLRPRDDIHTLSYLSQDQLTDESRWVKVVNSRIKSISHTVNLPSSPTFADIHNFISSNPQPVSDFTYYAESAIYAKASQLGFKVVLDGHGGDELLGGYDGYAPARFKESLHPFKPYQALDIFRGSVANSSYSHATKQLLRALFSYASDLLPLSSRPLPLTTNLLAALKVINGYPFPSCLTYKKSLSADTSLRNSLFNALVSTSCPHQLLGADSNSMRFSVENRVPFLNPDLVSAIQSLPQHYLVQPRPLVTKHLLRTALAGILPEEILKRHDKIGYATPKSTIINLARDEYNYVCQLAESSRLNTSYCLRYLFRPGTSSILLEGFSWRLLNLILITSRLPATI